MIKLTFPIEPVAKGRPRAGQNGHMFTPPRTRSYEIAIRTYAIAQYRKPALTGPINLTINFYMKKPKRPKDSLPIVKPDLDNLVKSIKDPLNGVVWVDDSQVTDLFADKRYAEDGTLPRIEVTIKPIIVTQKEPAHEN